MSIFSFDFRLQDILSGDGKPYKNNNYFKRNPVKKFIFKDKDVIRANIGQQRNQQVLLNRQSYINLRKQLDKPMKSKYTGLQAQLRKALRPTLKNKDTHKVKKETEQEIYQKMLFNLIPNYMNIKDLNGKNIFMKPTQNQNELEVSIDNDKYTLQFLPEINAQNQQDSLIFDVQGKKYGIQRREINKIMTLHYARMKQDIKLLQEEQQTMFDQMQREQAAVNTITRELYSHKIRQKQREIHDIQQALDQQHNDFKNIYAQNQELRQQSKELDDVIQLQIKQHELEKQYFEETQAKLRDQMQKDAQQFQYERQEQIQKHLSELQAQEQDHIAELEQRHIQYEDYVQNMTKKQQQELLDRQKQHEQRMQKLYDEFTQEQEARRIEKQKVDKQYVDTYKMLQDIEYKYAQKYAEEDYDNKLKTLVDKTQGDIIRDSSLRGHDHFSAMQAQDIKQLPIEFTRENIKKDTLAPYQNLHIRKKQILGQEIQRQDIFDTDFLGNVKREKLSDKSREAKVLLFNPRLRDMRSESDIDVQEQLVQKKTGLMPPQDPYYLQYKIQHLENKLQKHKINEQALRDQLSNRMQQQTILPFQQKQQQEDKNRLEQDIKDAIYKQEKIQKKKDVLLQQMKPMQEDIQQQMQGDGTRKLQLKKIKMNEVQAPVIQNKYKDYVNIHKEILDYPIFHPPSIVQIGKKGQGKTSLVQYLVQNFMQYNKNVKTECYVYIKSIDDTYRKIKEIYDRNGFKFQIITDFQQFQDILDKFQQQNDQYIQKGITQDTEYVNEKKKQYIYHRIFIFDDFANEFKLKGHKELFQLYWFNSRHFRCVNILNTQHFKQLFPCIRQNIDVLILYKNMQSDVVLDICREYFGRDKIKEMQNIYSQLMQRPQEHDFLVIDFKNKELRFNMSEKILNSSLFNYNN